MKQHSSYKIGKRLVHLSLAVAFTVVLGYGWYFVNRMTTQLPEHFMSYRANQFVAPYQSLLADALTENDNQATQKIIVSLEQDDRILSADLYSPDGVALLPDHRSTPVREFMQQHIVPVTLMVDIPDANHEVIAYLKLVVDRQGSFDSAKTLFDTTSELMLITLLVGFVLGLYLTRLFYKGRAFFSN